MSDEDDRTTEIGLFNYAHSYWRSAVALHKAKVRATHPDSPVWFLYFHAIELYLKSYLRAHGLSVAELRKKFGHRICCLSDEAKRRGLTFDDEDIEVISLMVCMDLTDVRYIKTGAFQRPSHEALDRTCNSFHASVGGELRARGFPVRQNK